MNKEQATERSKAESDAELFGVGFLVNGCHVNASEVQFISRKQIQSEAARVPVIERYAQAAHWYINANDQKLLEHGDNRRDASWRVHTIECELVKMGFEFAAPTEPSKTEQADAPSDAEIYRAWDEAGSPCALQVFSTIYKTVWKLATTPPASAAGERELFELARATGTFQVAPSGIPTWAATLLRWQGWEARAALASKPLPEQVAQDKEDAERYRWLRENNGNWRVQVAITRKEGDIYNWVHAMEGLDAVIDAARTRGEGSTNEKSK